MDISNVYRVWLLSIVRSGGPALWQALPHRFFHPAVQRYFWPQIQLPTALRFGGSDQFHLRRARPQTGQGRFPQWIGRSLVSSGHHQQFNGKCCHFHPRFYPISRPVQQRRFNPTVFFSCCIRYRSLCRHVSVVSQGFERVDCGQKSD